MLDQPAGLMARIKYVVNIVGAIKAYEEQWTKAGWIEDNPEIMSIMTAYWDIRDEVENGSIQA